MTTRDDLELATERVVSICRGMNTTGDALSVLGVAVQVIACITEPGREQALARVTEILKLARKELAAHYDTYMSRVREAEARMERWQKVHQKLEETLTVWIEGDPFEAPDNKAGDKTKH